MIRPWIRALARKCSSGHPSRPLGRRALLRLEAVEDRTVAAALQFTAPEPIAAPGSPSHGLVSDRPAPTKPDHPAATVDQADGPGSATPDSVWGFHGFHPLDLPAPRGDTLAPESRELDVRFRDPSTPVPDAREPDGSSPAPAATPAADTKSVPDAASAAVRPAAARTSAPAAPPPSPGSQPTPAAERIPQDAGRPGSVRASFGTPAADRATTAFDGRSKSANGSEVRDAAAAVRGRPGPIVRPARPESASKGAQSHADLSDGALLHRFAALRDQAAFTALVQRHAPFVLGVCQRVLGDWHAAQDASQATFLILARKAGILDRGGPLGGWLYKVAYHLALRARGSAARQRQTERDAGADRPTHDPNEDAPEVEVQELRQALREELNRLPEKYRAPLTLCYLDGRTHDDAAREIGMPRGSVAKRLGEGLERLRERLMDRGFML